MGLSTLVAKDARSLSLTVSWGDYARGTYRYEAAGDGEEKSAEVWQRTPREQPVGILLGAGGEDPRVVAVPGSGGLELHVLERAVPDSGADGRIPPGTRSVSLFLVNRRHAVEKDSDQAYHGEPQIAR